MCILLCGYSGNLAMLPRMEGVLICSRLPLSSFMTVPCTEACSMWRIKWPYCSSRSALKSYWAYVEYNQNMKFMLCGFFIRPLFFFFFFNRHCNPCGFWPAYLSLSILSRKVFTECLCQRHVKTPTWRTSD